jgi:hypothetical protein
MYPTEIKRRSLVNEEGAKVMELSKYVKHAISEAFRALCEGEMSENDVKLLLRHVANCEDCLMELRKYIKAFGDVMDIKLLVRIAGSTSHNGVSCAAHTENLNNEGCKRCVIDEIMGISKFCASYRNGEEYDY